MLEKDPYYKALRCGYAAEGFAVPAAVIQVLTDQLVRGVVHVCEALASLCDRGDVAVFIVFIVVGGIIAVLIGGNERGPAAVRTGNVCDRGIVDRAVPVLQLDRGYPAHTVVGIYEAFLKTQRKCIY